MEKLVIDRFEGNYAVCVREDQSIKNILISQIPAGAREGTVIIQEGDSIIIDEAATKKLEEEVQEATKDLWK